jgi:VIT1/CCC1 family predicted Fe2+/Mn2+ transporter
MEQAVEPLPATPARMSLAARLTNVFATPGEVFDDVLNTPPTEANWLVPAIIVMILGWLGAALIFSQDSIKFQMRDLAEKAIQKQIEKSHMPEAQAEAVRQAAEKYGDIGMKVNAVMMPAIAAWVLPFWGGLIIWLVGKFALKGTFSYMKAVEAAGLVNMIVALDAIVRTLLIVVTGNLFASPSLMLLVPDWNPENNVHALLALFNVMTFWTLAIRAIALARLSRQSFLKSAIWVFGLWVLYTGLIFVAGAAGRAVMAKVHGG